MPLVFSIINFQKNHSDLPFLPPMKKDRYVVPSGIRPVMQRTVVEVNKIDRKTLALDGNLFPTLFESTTSILNPVQYLTAPLNLHSPTPNRPTSWAKQSQ